MLCSLTWRKLLCRAMLHRPSHSASLKQTHEFCYIRVLMFYLIWTMTLIRNSPSYWPTIKMDLALQITNSYHKVDLAYWNKGYAEPCFIKKPLFKICPFREGSKGGGLKFLFRKNQILIIWNSNHFFKIKFYN